MDPADEIPRSFSSLSLNKIKVYRRIKNSSMIKTPNKIKFCKTYCKTCHRMCPRALAKYKAQLNVRRRCGRSDNFVLISAKYIQELYYYMHKSLLVQFLTDDFLRSLIASITLFVIGISLTRKSNAWNLTKTVNRIKIF